MSLLRLQGILALLLVLSPSAFAQNAEDPDSLHAPRVLLWPDGAPGAKGDSPADKPALFLYLASPQRATGAGVVVCPGGGYSTLATGHEGRAVAQWLNEYGISAFVLRYRHGPRYQHPRPLRDAQRAVRMVRAHAETWQVDPGRVGVLGFSAGGHLASTVGTHIDPPDSRSPDSLEHFSTRPDFLTLIYPVISFVESFTHTGSRRMLLGSDPDSSMMRRLSSEKQVTDRTPPTFLIHAGEDEVVPAENSVAFYRALRDADVPAELHLYEKGGHGFGLAPTDPVLSTWTDRWVDWARERELLGGGPWR